MNARASSDHYGSGSGTRKRGLVDGANKGMKKEHTCDNGSIESLDYFEELARNPEL